jgi:hypothetical protein
MPNRGITYGVKDASLGFLRARRRLQNARSSVVNPTWDSRGFSAR